MTRVMMRRASLVLAMLVVGVSGCGVLEHLVLDPARLAAEESVKGVVRQAVTDAIEQLDPIPLFGPLLDEIPSP